MVHSHPPTAARAWPRLLLCVLAFPAAAHADAEDEARRQFLRGKDALRRGDLEEASRSFARAIDLDATEVGARRYLGKTRSLMQQWDLAVDAYRGYLEMVPNAPDAHAIRQAVRQIRDQRRRALAGRSGVAGAGPPVRLPAGLVPGTPEAADEARRRYDFGRALNDNSAEEEAHYRQSVTLDPTFAPAYYNLGILYLMRGDMERALWAHTRFAALTPGSHEGHFLLGVDHQMRGDLVAAEQAYRRAVARSASHFDSLNNLAVVLEKQGRYDEAARWYRRAIEVAPAGSELRARYNLGDMYLKRNRLDEAVEQLRAVLAHAEDAGPAPALAGGRAGRGTRGSLLAASHNALGRAYELQDKQEEAIAEYTAALALAPGLKEARANLVRVRRRVVKESK